MKTTIGTFKPTGSLPQQGIVLLFDLEGFSKFFSQPDVQDYVPKYLNIILEAFDICIYGGEAYWAMDAGNKAIIYEPTKEPIHSKFLGDGALYIWNYNDFDEPRRILLINRLWTLKTHFDKILLRASDEIPILDIPKRIRIGLAAGTVYKLTFSNSNKEEFVGYSINLASRLQSYCRSIGFIVSGRLNIQIQKLTKDNYKRVVANSIKGFPQEIVVIDNDDYDGLDEDVRKSLFTEL
jgi:class 3 adenylate cyclase